MTMNIMEFKIAAIGSHLYGDLALISDTNELGKPMDKGFRDEKLKRML
jgi:hypothetical protein